MRQLNKDINIFVSCHKDFYVPENKYLIPIHVGAKNSKAKLDMVRDDSGENISDLNPSFCELTAQYWAWKNVDCEYYGFFHYRRYLSFAEEYIGDPNRAYSDIFLENITDSVLDKLKIKEDHMKELISKYDIILPKRANLKYERADWNTVYKHYKESPQHFIEDYDAAIKIIHELYPEFDKYVKKAINGSRGYFLNMYIMKKKYFNEYMEWLFPILMKFHKQRDYTNASVFVWRTPGLVAERLVPIFMLYLEDKYKDLKVKELQNTFFEDCTDPYLQPKFENKIGICMATDNNYAKHLGVALTSLALNSSPDKTYDIVVFDNKLTVSNKDLLTKTVAGHNNISIRFVKTGDYVYTRKMFERDHINKSCYTRFVILDLLRNFDKVIYLDCDLIVHHDIADMYDIDLGDNYVAAIRDIVMASWNNEKGEFGESYRKYNSEELGLKNIYDYFNSGVMIFNVKEMSKHITTDELFDLATSKNWRWQDQDILNKVCADKVLLLPSKWNFMPHQNTDNTRLIEFSAPKDRFEMFLEAKKDPYIIHYAGHFQPMYHADSDFADVYWKYARQSVFYEEILGEKFASIAYVWQTRKFKVPFKTKVKKVLKKVFPANTRRGNFARKVWRRMKRK